MTEIPASCGIRIAELEESCQSFGVFGAETGVLHKKKSKLLYNVPYGGVKRIVQLPDFWQGWLNFLSMGGIIAGI